MAKEKGWRKRPIATFQESSLHAALKAWYAQPGDRLEVPVEGYQVDIFRPDFLVEIQTGNFGALRPKLEALLPDYRIRVIYPIARERWVKRVTAEGEPVARRKSPKRGRVEELFAELVRLAELATWPNFSLEVVVIQEEVVWRDDGQGSWRRRGWSVIDRRLLGVQETRLFSEPKDYLALVPERLWPEFTNGDLAEALGLSQRLAGQMTYCLRAMGMIRQDGKRGRSNLFVA